MVRQKNRLRPLHVGVTRHNRILMFLGQSGNYLLQQIKSLDDTRCLMPQIHPEIHRHLVIATSGRMKFLCSRSRNFNQPGFNVHMDVFQAVIKLKAIFIDFLSDFFKSPNDRIGVIIGDNRDFCQHFAMRHTALNIIGIKPPVHLN